MPRISDVIQKEEGIYVCGVRLRWDGACACGTPALAHTAWTRAFLLGHMSTMSDEASPVGCVPEALPHGRQAMLARLDRSSPLTCCRAFGSAPSPPPARVHVFAVAHREAASSDPQIPRCFSAAGFRGPADPQVLLRRRLPATL